MLKVALYINDKNITIDISNPEKGNPGIGGTQFNFITLPYYFNKFFPGEIEWFIISYGARNFPPGIRKIGINDQKELETLCDEHSFDYFIWKPGSDHIPKLLPENQNCIAWCHNIPPAKTLNYLASSTQVRKVVFAGHEVLDILRDHPIILKSTVIFNGFDPEPYISSPDLQKEENLVVFLGSLVPAKYFHLIAKAWKKVIKSNPKARLLVIGSGKLYNKNQELGPMGIAEKDYEKMFTSYLSDSNGVLKSVEFLGLLGEEKIQYLKKATVGVINPHGNSEVCPGSAIEFQACETPVVAGGRYGNLDTIVHRKTGFLVKNEKQLINKIIYLLRNPKRASEMGKDGKDFITSKFDQKRIIDLWKGLFEQLERNEKGNIYPMKGNWLYNLKIIFEFLRIIKFKFGLFKNAPSIYEYIEKRKNQ